VREKGSDLITPESKTRGAGSYIRTIPLPTREVRMAKDKSQEHEDLNAMCGRTCQRRSTLPSSTHTPGVARERIPST
jgi:hypothetical protein